MLSQAESFVRKDSAGIPMEMRIDLRIDVLERQFDGALLIRAGGMWQGAAIGVEILSKPRKEGMGDRALSGSEFFRSDMELRRIGKASDALDAIVQSLFDLPNGESMIKGFEAGSYVEPRRFENARVLCRLADPNVQGKMDWRLDCFIDPPTKQISLYVHRPQERD